MSDSFRSWFSGSKAVTADGSPMVLYHGTKSKVPFEAFRPGRVQEHMDLGFGVHFAEDRLFAAEPAYVGKHGHVMECHIKAVKPWNAIEAVAVGTAEHDVLRELFKRHRLRKIMLEEVDGRVWGKITAVKPSRALKVLSEAGYDSIIYDAINREIMPGGYYTVGRTSRSWVVFDPEQAITTAAAARMALTPDADSPEDSIDADPAMAGVI